MTSVVGLRPRLLARTIALLAAIAVPVYPCGGPEHYPIDAPLATGDAYLQAVETVDDFDYRVRPELRFLYPFVSARTPGSSALWRHSYTDADWNRPRMLDTTATLTLDREAEAFRAAGRMGDPATLAQAARAVLHAALGLPASVADEDRLAVRRAVEALELFAAQRVGSAGEVLDVALTSTILRTLYGRDSLASAEARALPAWAQEVLTARTTARDSLAAWSAAHPRSPRQGSLQFVALQLAMRHGIPDGWARQTRDSVPPARWSELATLHDDWTRRFPQHPMAPWVALSRLRLAYFAGDTTSAWERVLALYPQHPLRALDEMRFLLRQSMFPPTLDDSRIDHSLRAALLGEVPLDGRRWQREWALAQPSNEPWAVATRDRLLWRAARDTSLARGLPPTALMVAQASLTPLGAVLRLIALTRVGRIRDAIVYADSIGTDSLVAPMKVQLLLAAHRWCDALAVPSVSREARQYLVRILAPDSVLESLAAGHDALLAAEARRTLATRVAASGEWRTAGDRLAGRDGRRGAEWRRVASLAGDSSLSGRLALARHMRARNGLLFWGNDKIWYRSLNWRLRAVREEQSARFNPMLPWRADDEAGAIARHFRDGFEMYHAARAYADFLSHAPRGDPRRPAAVHEANLSYNWLVNWDITNATFWRDELEHDGIGPVIRQAGKR